MHVPQRLGDLWGVNVNSQDVVYGWTRTILGETLGCSGRLELSRLLLSFDAIALVLEDQRDEGREVVG